MEKQVDPARGGGGGGVECFLTSNRSTLEISKLSTRFGTIYMLYWDKE